MDAAHHSRDELLRARQATCAMVRPALGNRGLPSHAQERLPHQRPSIGHRTRPAGLPWCRYGGRLARLSSDDAGPRNARLALHRVFHRRRMEGPLLLHHRKPTPSQTTAVSRQCDTDGGSYGWPLGPQARWTAWSSNSLARSSTSCARSQSVPNTRQGATASRFRPLNTGGVMWLNGQLSKEGRLRDQEKAAKPPSIAQTGWSPMTECF